jgi:hypothetical protein
MVYPAKYSALNALALTDEAKRTLTRVIRVAFPHPRIPDGPYGRMAEKIAAEAEDSTWFRMALTQGLLTLNSLSDAPFVELSDDAALKVLKRIADLEFFGFIRRTTVLHLYDDHEVWEALGYEGESFSKGGYLHRGFDDLDWLPDPRVETYTGPTEFVEIADSVPLARIRGTEDAVRAAETRDTSNQPGPREAEMAEVKK